MIKKILVSTDYSDNAKAAARFAVEMAKMLNAELVLFHTYYIQTTSAEFIEFLDMNEFHTVQQELLEGFKKELNCPEVKIHTELAFGINTVDEINAAAKKHKVDLLVMGLKGMSQVESVLIGSTVLSLFTASSVPVLALPPFLEYKALKKIAFAYDGEDVESKEPFKVLGRFATDQEAIIQAFTIVKEEDRADFNKEVKGIILKNLLGEEIAHSYDVLVNEEVQEGIDAFVLENKSDILAILPRKHSFFERLFSISHSKRYAIQSKLPLLILPIEE
jgi:nucleotide-binding universal stress UspA family protein